MGRVVPLCSCKHTRPGSNTSCVSEWLWALLRGVHAGVG